MTTTVNGVLLIGGGVAAGTKGKLAWMEIETAVPAFLATKELVVPPAVTIPVSETTGAWTVDLAALPTGYAYRFTAVIDGGGKQFSRLVTVPTSGTVAYADLVDVAPETVIAYGGIEPAGLSVATRAGLDGTYARLGLSLTDFPKFRKAIARVRSNGGDAKVLCAGDSTVAYNNTGSWPSVLTKMLNGTGAAFAQGLAVPPYLPISNDSRWTTSGSWPTSRGAGFGNQAGYYGNNTNGNLVFADPTVLADRFDVYYVDNPGMGTGTFTATGGSATPIVAGSTYTIKKATISAGAASKTNTLTVTANAAGFYVLAVEPWLSTVSTVRVGNAGVSTTAGSDWVAGDPFGGLNAIQAYAPDLTIVSLGVNDGVNGASAATYLAQMQLIATAARVSGDVIFVTPIPSQGPSQEATLEPQYRAALLGSGLPVIDTYEHLGSFAAYNALGYMLDGRHPNAAGHADLGAWYKSQLAPLV